MKPRGRFEYLPLCIVSLRLGAMLATTLGLLAVGPARSVAQVISSPVQISNVPDIENQPDVVVSGNVAVAVWMAVHLNCSHGVEWSLSRDGGTTWGQGAALPGEIYGGGSRPFVRTPLTASMSPE